MENKISVIRYVRPQVDGPTPNLYDFMTGLYSNLYGVTVVFDIDYDTRKVKASWSVCNGDNFEKARGVLLALQHAQNFEFDLEMVTNNSGLVNALLYALGNLYVNEWTSYTEKEQVFLSNMRTK